MLSLIKGQSIVTNSICVWINKNPPLKRKADWSHPVHSREQQYEFGVLRQRPFYIKERQLGRGQGLLKAEVLLNYFWECIMHDLGWSRRKARGRAERECCKEKGFKWLQHALPTKQKHPVQLSVGFLSNRHSQIPLTCPDPLPVPFWPWSGAGLQRPSGVSKTFSSNIRRFCFG